MPVVCPIFFVETLADLGKEESKRGSAESAVIIVHSPVDGSYSVIAQGTVSRSLALTDDALGFAS